MTTSKKSMPYVKSVPPSLAGYTACAWAFIFGVVHIYWAVGGTAGLQGNSMTGVLLMINLVAIPLCFLAAIVAFALTKSWQSLLPHRMWIIAAWGASVLLAVRGMVGIFQSVFLQNSVPLLLMAYDSWFLLGGILFGLVALLNHGE